MGQANAVGPISIGGSFSVDDRFSRLDRRPPLWIDEWDTRHLA